MPILAMIFVICSSICLGAIVACLVELLLFMHIQT